MHNRFDQFVKRLVREGFSPAGRVETEAEVTPDARRIDVWFVPTKGRAAARALAPLGLFGRMGRTSCTLEPYHRTPSGDQVADCWAKHRFFCGELARRRPNLRAPTQWIVSSGRATAAIAGLGFRKSRRTPGIYDAPPLMRTKLVVVSELPRTRDTLLVRLMGAGRTLRRAIADLRSLPHDAAERRLALPILVRLRLEIHADAAKQTTIDREFLMTTHELDKYLQQLSEDGRKKGLDQGFAQAVLAAYRARFGAPPAALVARVGQAGNHAALQRWLVVVTTGTAEEIAAALRSSAQRKKPSGTTGRRRASPRRAEAPR